MTGFVVLGDKCQKSLISANCYYTNILCISITAYLDSVSLISLGKEGQVAHIVLRDNLIPCSGSQLVGCNPSFFFRVVETKLNTNTNPIKPTVSYLICKKALLERRT